MNHDRSKNRRILGMVTAIAMLAATFGTAAAPVEELCVHAENTLKYQTAPAVQPSAGEEMTNPPMPGTTAAPAETTTAATTAAPSTTNDEGMTNPPMPGQTTAATTTSATTAAPTTTNDEGMTNPPMPGQTTAATTTTSAGTTTTAATTAAPSTTNDEGMTNPPMPGQTTAATTTTSAAATTTSATTAAPSTTNDEGMTNPPMPGQTTAATTTTSAATTTTTTVTETTTTEAATTTETTTTEVTTTAETTTESTTTTAETTTSAEETTTSAEETTTSAEETTTSAEETTTSAEETTTSAEETTTSAEETTTSAEETTSTEETTTSAETTASASSGQVKTNDEGKRYAVDANGELLKGYFALKPDFMLGDVNADGAVDATDAAILLIAAAENGSSGKAAEEYIYENDTEHFDGAAKALSFGDTDSNGTINAADASTLLEYAAAAGADASTPALGTGLYYADADGFLQYGLIKTEDGKCYLAGEDGKLLTGWQTFTDGETEKTCCFDANGVMLTNTTVTDANGDTVTLGEDGTRVVNGFLDTPEGKTYIGGDGKRVTGIQKIADKSYYFNSDGIMQTGLIVLGDMTCYAGEDGALVSGYVAVDSKGYCFDAETYAMVTEQWATCEDGVRYFGKEGEMLTGWQIIDKDTFYFNEQGLKQTGMTVVGDKTYFLDENGVRRAGWKEIDDKRYYFFPIGCYMATGWADINNIRFYFYEDGVMAADTEIEGQKIQANGYAMSDLLCEATVKIQSGLAAYGTTPDAIFDYMRETNRYKHNEATKTREQLDELGWTYLVNYAAKNYYTVCYYMAAKLDYIFKLFGYTSRIVYSTHESGDHYSNQVLIGEEWVNYDATNNLRAYTWEQMVKYGNYVLLDYIEPEYK